MYGITGRNELIQSTHIRESAMDSRFSFQETKQKISAKNDYMFVGIITDQLPEFLSGIRQR